MRDVAAHSIYGVDRNPLAVDLCRVALWIARRIERIADDSPEAIRRKRALFEQRHDHPARRRQYDACQLWTAAFWQPLRPGAPSITTATLASHLAGREVDPHAIDVAERLAAEHRFFHWPLEFPEVFDGCRRGHRAVVVREDGRRQAGRVDYERLRPSVSDACMRRARGDEPAWYAGSRMSRDGREGGMKTASIFVRATWDGDARVWVATSTDIDGLAVEAETHEALTEKVVAAVADLIELNGIDSDLPEIPVRVLSEDLRRVANPHC